MLLAFCARLDLPIDASRERIQRTKEHLDALLGALQPGIEHLSLAVSGAAIRCFERECFQASLKRIAELASARQIELLGTPAHGALLPLLPDGEMTRQLRLSDVANREWFGDTYSPDCLWPPQLATSPKVATLAASLGYSSMLVDEAAMRKWPAVWPGDRIDAVVGQPGFFAIPVNRDASARILAGTVGPRRSLDRLVPPHPSALDERYLVAAFEISELSPGVTIPSDAVGGPRSITLQELLTKTSLAGATSLLPSSRWSTPEELSRGLPFATWFSPDSPRQALQWRLILHSLELLNQLQSQGFGALPAIGHLRTTLDRVERESTWRLSSDLPQDLEERFEALGTLGGTRTQELRQLCRELQGARPAAVHAASEPGMSAHSA